MRSLRLPAGVRPRICRVVSQSSLVPLFALAAGRTTMADLAREIEALAGR